jgi:hypothetical protein
VTSWARSAERRPSGVPSYSWTGTAPGAIVKRRLGKALSVVRHPIKVQAILQKVLVQTQILRLLGPF